MIAALLLIIAGINSLYAQSTLKLIEKGNSAYAKKDFLQAKQYYNDAVKYDNIHRFPEAVFNLGNAFYKLKDYANATMQYKTFITIQKDNAKKAPGYFNVGNCLLAQKKYDESILAYQEAVRLNPHDEEARYNLAYANAMIQQGRQSAIQLNKRNQTELQIPEMVIPPLSPDELKKLEEAINKDELLTQKQLVQHNLLGGRKKIVKDW